MAEEDQQHAKLAVTFEPSGSSAGNGDADHIKQFEILAITAGIGNGWDWRAEALQESVDLWDGTKCFIDHSWLSHSVHDLAGVCSEPIWDGEKQGVRLKLSAMGPGAGILRDLAEVMLSDGAKPDVGFSADILFKATGKKVDKIWKVLSVDLVIDPARGGKFLRALNSRQKELLNMAENDATNTGAVQPGTTQPVMNQVQLQAELEEMRQARQKLDSLSELLIEQELSASKLPTYLVESIKKRFAGQPYNPKAVDEAISEARTMMSELTGSAVVRGPGRISGMFDSRDKLQAAVDDMMGAPRDEKSAKLQVDKLSGIKELYMMLTGDYDLHGGYYLDRAKLATTADFTGLVKNALNKIVVNTWDELGRAGYNWWQDIVTAEHFDSLNSVTGTLVGTVGALPEIAEGAEYTELAVGDSPETGTFKKYGGYIPLTLELIDRDETRKLKAYARELASAGLRKISSLVAAIFSSASGAGPTMADGGALFNATAVTTAGGHANYLTTALAAAEWEVVSKAVYNQPMLIKNAAGYYGTGPKMALNPRFCLVPRALTLTAMKILYPQMENASGINSENLQKGLLGDVKTVPEWTDVTDWAAAVDPKLAPAIYVGERFGLLPEVYIAGDEMSPAVFTNDESRLKVRHFLAVWVNDFRPLHKSVVGG
jgi:hypothetical protein